MSFESVTLVGVLDNWPNKRGQRVKKKINSTMVDEPGGKWFSGSMIELFANKPVAKHGSVLATSVVHAEAVQWGHHL